MHLFQHPPLPAPGSPRPSICILARKNLARNTRVVRQAKTLSEAGFKVTVAAMELPHPEVQALAPDVTYLQILSRPRLVEFLRWAYKTTRSNSLLTEGFDASRLSRLEMFFYASLMVLGLQIYQMIKSVRIRRVFRKIPAFVTLPFRIRVFIGTREVWRSTLRYVARLFRILSRKVWFRFVSSSRTISRRYVPSEITDKFMLSGIVTKLKTMKSIQSLLVLPANHVSLSHDSMARMKRFVPGTNFRLPKNPETSQNGVNGSPRDLKALIRAMSNALYTVYFAWSADKVLKGIRFDYCQAHDSYALLAASIVASRGGTRLIYDAVEIVDDRSGGIRHASPDWLTAWEKRREEAIVRQADLVTAVGAEVAQWTSRRYGIEMPTVVRNCSLFMEEPSGNDQIRGTFGLREEDKIVLFVGSVYKGQGVNALIQSLSYLAPDIHLVLLGFESQKGYFDELKEHGARFGVLDRFHILDPCPPHMVASVAAAADIGIVFLQKTSLNHLYALPNKLFEYIMARLPIASARLPGIENLVNEYGIGMVFDEEDEHNIAEIINTLLRPANLSRMKERVRKAARELCWEREGQRYVEAIKRLGNGQKE